MPLLGTAAVAMWWSVEPAMRSEFTDWHAHEHFPERLSIPGFCRGSRWSNVNDPRGVFVLYELAEYGTLTSPEYLGRLNAPTPWSTKMMPHHHGMMRSQARLAASYGGGLSGFVATARLSPRPAMAATLEGSLRRLLEPFAVEPGLTGGHLLITATPGGASPTAEQQIRGKDTSADWIVIVAGYDRQRLEQLLERELAPASLAAIGALDGAKTDIYSLAFCLTPADLTPPHSAGSFA